LKIKLSLKDSNSKTLMEDTQENLTVITFNKRYQLGDFYEVELEKISCYLVVQLDPALKPALIYIPNNNWKYKIPFSLQRYSALPSNAFEGVDHYACVRKATRDEVIQNQNLAFNSYDQRCDNGAFPHVTANAETRGEEVFFAKNVIDGYFANTGHGRFPYQSWGIDQRKDAELKLDFGREVIINRLGILLRADYPHDSYWTEVNVEFSDKTNLKIHLKKTKKIQYVSIPEKRVNFIKLNNLVKDETKEDSSFPSLTQLIVQGKNIL